MALGFSIILSAISFIFAIDRNYPPARLSNKENLTIAIIWLFFGIILLTYGTLLSGFISFTTQFFGILYIILGGISSIFLAVAIQFERNFHQVIEKATLDIKYPPAGIMSLISRSFGGVTTILGVFMVALGVGILKRTKKYDDTTEKVIKNIIEEYFPK
jgi:hypothetical protein